MRQFVIFAICASFVTHLAFAQVPDCPDFAYKVTLKMTTLSDYYQVQGLLNAQPLLNNKSAVYPCWSGAIFLFELTPAMKAKDIDAQKKEKIVATLEDVLKVPQIKIECSEPAR